MYAFHYSHFPACIAKQFLGFLQGAFTVGFLADDRFNDAPSFDKGREILLHYLKTTFPHERADNDDFIFGFP